MKTSISIFSLLCILLSVDATAQQYPEMIKVEGGSFTMGYMAGRDSMSSKDYVVNKRYISSYDGIYADEKPAHKVSVSSFSIGKYEVTVAQYRAFCQATGRKMPQAPNWGLDDNHPIVYITWADANEYCKWLSGATGKKFRLPTEAEWEYAARGGNRSQNNIFSGSKDLDNVAWTGNSSGKRTQAAGRLQANELGIYDMTGNAWEWCADFYDANYYGNSASSNPAGPGPGSGHVLRGGSWASAEGFCRIANRNQFKTDLAISSCGFRVVASE